jgi:PiT family inorganic phosphate transporter
VFDFINGFHDAANSIATIVSTKVLTPLQAVIWAALFNFVAFFIFKDHAVANTIGKTVHAEYITLWVILAGIIAAIGWNLLTWWLGIPSSSSHTLIGGFGGAAIAHAFIAKGQFSFDAVLEMGSIIKIILFIFLAPILGMVVSYLFTHVTIMRNTWTKAVLMLGMIVGIYFLFQHYEQVKLKENYEKFYKIDAMKKDVEKNPALKAKIDSLETFVVKAEPYFEQFNSVRGKGVAALIQSNVDSKVDVEKLGKKLQKSNNDIQTSLLIGVLLIFIVAFIYAEKFRTPTAARLNTLFKRLQLVSSAAFSIGHGGNDAQKVMGIIAAAMICYYGPAKFADPGVVLKEMAWIPLACYVAIGFGTMSGGWKIVKTMGSKITKVTPLEGVVAETSGAMTLFVTEQMGIPVSTTHTITGSIIGVGAHKRLSAVRWGITINLMWAWILTIPVSAVFAALVYWVISLFL